MRKLSKQERAYLIVIVLVLGLLAVKSLKLDPYIPVDEQEIQALEAYHQQILDQGQNPLKVKRVIAMTLVDEDLEDSGYPYRFRVRYYLLGIIPYWEVNDTVEP